MLTTYEPEEKNQVCIKTLPKSLVMPHNLLLNIRQQVTFPAGEKKPASG